MGLWLSSIIDSFLGKVELCAIEVTTFCWTWGICFCIQTHENNDNWFWVIFIHFLVCQKKHETLTENEYIHNPCFVSSPYFLSILQRHKHVKIKNMYFFCTSSAWVWKSFVCRHPSIFCKTLESLLAEIYGTIHKIWL
jgi:hypothetical protein